MKIVITIDTGTGAAFADREAEVWRILKRLSEQARDGLYPPKLYDINGNACGSVKLTRNDDNDDN